MSNLPIFVVHCERIGRRNAYYVRFSYNKQLVDRIKVLPKESRKWDSNVLAWELTTNSLYHLIKKYKKSNKIHFDFDNESRKVFINQIKKIKEKESEKREFIKELNIKKENWVRYKKELEETYEKYSDKLHKLLKQGIKLFPHQIVAAMFMNATRNTLISHEMGLGKAQDVDSKLFTPNGWVRMGNIKVGDYVIGSDGKPKKVLGVFPQGEKDNYDIYFNDKTSVRSCDEHLWDVRNNKKNPFITKSLREIMEGGLKFKNGNNKWYIPIVKPIEFEKKELKINPYILGCLLGDSSDILTTTNYKLINQALKKINLKGKYLHDKYIPNEYKFSSINQRIELLQGILDTDGHSRKSGIIELTLASKQLIDDIQFIVQSLGGIGKINEKWVNKKGEKKLYWKIIIKLPLEIIPFKLQRKLDLFKPSIKFLPNRAIVDIKYVGKKKSQCILIDSDDHLYVTDHCALTHNTLSSILYVEMNGFEKVFVITPNSLKFNFYYEVKKFTDSNVYVVNWRKNDCGIDDAKYIIVNYDFFNPSRPKSKKKEDDRFLKKWEKLDVNVIDCLILDECQKIKNTKTNIFSNYKRTFKKKMFRDGKESKVFLSGTPSPNRAYELYTVLNQISPTDFPTKKHFYEYYCGMTYDIDGWGYTMDDNLETKFEELYHKISPFTHRKRKFEALKDLPDKSYQKIILEMNDDENETYSKIENNVANEFTINPISNQLTIMLRLRQYLSDLKVKYVIELIENVLETNEKIIIVDYFKDALKKLKEKFGDSAALHIGDKSVEERSEIVKKFQDPNSNIRIFLGSIQTCGYGLTLTASSKMFIITLPYSVGDYDQVADRCHRIGQKNSVNIYPIIFPDTIDDYVYSSIESKRKEIIKVLDNENYKSNIEESVFNEVINKILSKHGKKI